MNVKCSKLVNLNNVNEREDGLKYLQILYPNMEEYSTTNCNTIFPTHTNNSNHELTRQNNKHTIFVVLQGFFIKETAWPYLL